MCDYCSKDKRTKRNYLFNSPILSIKINSNKGLDFLEIKHYNHKSEIVDSAKTINYCPMCGRKLG